MRRVPGEPVPQVRWESVWQVRQKPALRASHRLPERYQPQPLAVPLPTDQPGRGGLPVQPE